MILALNTSTAQFGIAVMDEQGTVLAESLISPRDDNFKNFMPSMESLLESSKIKMDDLKAIIASTGPGSFTGLRVGLSVAKGMAQGLQIPIIGVSCLESLANQLPYSVYPIAAILTSRKGEVFLARFQWDDNKGFIRLSEDRSFKIEALASVIHAPTIFIGNDFISHGSAIKKMLGNNALLAPSHLWNLKASCAGALGLERFHKKAYDDIQELIPYYIMPPDIRPTPH
jgi:tRNA threonylcarbamoyladenosine biosynthesis protein TsaB